MRILISIAIVTIAAGAAEAQSLTAAACRTFPLTSDLVLTTTDARTIRGQLQCLNDEGVRLRTLAGDVWEPLRRVRRLERPRDGVWDGALKGAIVGFIGGWACDTCSSPGAAGVGGSLLYGAIGAWIDARVGRRRLVIYERVPPTNPLSSTRCSPRLRQPPR